MCQGQGTIRFCDEIHRFHLAQHDAFLPWVEKGIIELTGALLSRCRVFVLQPLDAEELATLIRRALTDGDRGLGRLGLAIDDDALALLTREADGDARRALQALEAGAEYVTGTGDEGRGTRVLTSTVVA